MGFVRIAYILISFFILWTLSAQAAHEMFQFETKAQEQQFTQLLKEFRCVTCPNQSIGDSQAMVAKAMQQDIYDRLQRGETPQEIRQFLLSAYGDYVTYSPALKPNTWVLWLGPFGILLAGMLIWLRFFRTHSRHSV